MGRTGLSTDKDTGPGPRNKKPAERKGPSMVAVFTGILSVILCMLLVGFATSEDIIIISIITWALVGCTLLMRIGGKNFWDSKVDWATSTMGATWWFVASLMLLPGYYLVDVWASGLALTTFTAIIIGKMARHLPMWIMVIAGVILGYIIIWMNNWAIHRQAVLAVDMSQYVSWWYILPVLGTTLVVISITGVAQRIYYVYESGYKVPTLSQIERHL